jgi:hypothetical protein
VLSVDLAEVGHEEGIFLSRLAEVVVNVFNALAESVSNHLLSHIVIAPIMVVGMVAVVVQESIVAILHKDTIIRVFRIIK